MPYSVSALSVLLIYPYTSHMTTHDTRWKFIKLTMRIHLNVYFLFSYLQSVYVLEKS